MIATKRTSRRIAATVIAALVGLAAVVLPGTAATAASNPEILVSDDGVTFTPQLTTGLFTGLGLLVPEESISASLWVRNPSTTDGSMRLSVADLVTTSEVFTQNVTLTAVSGTGAWTWTLADLTACNNVIPSLPIRAGETVRIDMTVTMLDVDGQTAQDESAQLGMAVDVRDARSPFPTEPCAQPGQVDPTPTPDPGPDTPDGGLSDTGARVLSFAVISAGLLGLGFFLVFWRRRREREEQA